MRVKHDELLKNVRGDVVLWGCHSLVIGDWLVLQCSDPLNGVTFRLPHRFAGRCVDLATKKFVRSTSISLGPGETRVLRRQAGVE